MSFGAAFLHNRDLFPARRSGEAWGDRRLVLALPGGPYRFDGLNAVQEAIVHERFGGFRIAERVEQPGAAVESRIFRAPESDFREFDRRGWHYSIDFDYGPDAVRIAGLRLLARLDWRPSLAGALWTPDGGGDHFAGIFENFCRVLVAYRLLEQGGAVVHSAGVVRDGEALLFVGHSGAGKTTVSRMSLDCGATVLSDDLNALLPSRADNPVLEALPFTGDLGGGVSAGARFPLRAVMRLEKSPAESLVPLSRAEAVATLLACSPFVNADPHRRGDLLANLAALAAGLPAYALRFTLSGEMWGILPGNA